MCSVVFIVAVVMVLGVSVPAESLPRVRVAQPPAPTETPELPEVVPVYQGFGATTPGGAGQPVVRVTNLDDSGPGSLRRALSGGERTIVFDVAGTIELADTLHVRGAFVTIDGSTAPPPGITLRHHGLAIHGQGGAYYDCGDSCDDAHDVIVTGLRIRGAAEDGLRIAHGAYNVVVDHVSIQGSLDGNLDITESHDITVQWSVLAEPADVQKNMLIKYGPAHITLHHNVFVGAQQRNPQVKIDDEGTTATDTTLDMRNNVVWDWLDGYGTLVASGARANVADNIYGSPYSGRDEREKAIRVDEARAWIAGNVSLDGIGRLDGTGTDGRPFDAPWVDTQPACVAGPAVLAGAGVRPLDAVDEAYLARIVLPVCDEASAPSDIPWRYEEWLQGAAGR
jgi:hypothetical protein